MLLKSKEPRTHDIAQLHRLLQLSLDSRQRSLVEQELRCLQAGERNEDDAAYFIDFKLRDSKNWIVIHDLRFEHRSKVAQIDHLVINRFLQVFVLESKNFAHGVKITPEGEFLRWDGKGYRGIESPIEQNDRHIYALEQAISDRALAPKKFGFALPLSFKNVVLISPKSKILRPDKGIHTATVLKADAFLTHAMKEADRTTILEVGKIVSAESLKEFAQRLLWLHRAAAPIDYMSKFGITTNDCTPLPKPSDLQEKKVSSPGRVCDRCGADVDSKVIAFCRFNKARFGGKTLCRDCQLVS